MVELLIVADDFTGALDTGVKFVSHGVATQVITDVGHNFADTDETTQVLVIDAETRHLALTDAYKIVRQVAQNAARAGITYFYKKTDSALRGNIGCELQAMIDGTGKQAMHFIPALPAMNRVTVNGIHYIDDIPVAESVFGRDPFEPVRASDVASVIAEQTRTGVYSHRAGEGGHESGIHIYDVTTEQDMVAIGRDLLKNRELDLTAGCSGFAGVLPELLGLKGDCSQVYSLYPGLTVLCGSVNPITEKQLDHAEKAGFVRFHLKPEEKLSEKWEGSAKESEKIEQLYQSFESSGCIIVDSCDAWGGETGTYAKNHGIDQESLRERIVACLGRLLRKLLDRGLTSTLFLTGGDTVLAFMKQIGVSELSPIKEIKSGIILSRFIYREQAYYIITKSGGFGNTTLITDLASKIRSNHL